MQYQITVIDTDADMDKVRNVCADLLHENQQGDSFTGGNGNDIYIDTEKATVSEAIRRINALGYSTDEDE
jgi:hypothetical protein